MLITADEINKFLRLAGNEVTNIGKKYFEQGKVQIEDFDYKNDNNYTANVTINDNDICNLEVKKINGILDYRCSCQENPENPNICQHLIATLFDMYINDDKYILFKKSEEKLKVNSSLESFLVQNNDGLKNKDSFISYYENIEMNEHKKSDEVDIEPILDICLNDLEVSFKIGNTRMYILKDLYEFADSMSKSSLVKYGKEFEFINTIQNFNEVSRDMANFITKKTLEYYQVLDLTSSYTNLEKKYRNVFKLKYGMLDEFFEIIKNNYHEIEIKDSSYEYKIIKFITEDPFLKFEISESQDGKLIVKHNYDKYKLFYGQEYVYILYKDYLYRCSIDFKLKVLPLIEEFLKIKKDTLSISVNKATSFCEYVVPNLSELSRVVVNDELLQKYKAEKLGTKIYLDIDEKNNIVAEIKYCYLDVEFNPFDINEDLKCNRNYIEEKKVSDILSRYNFMIDTKRKIVYLSKEEDIFNFLKDGINLFMEKFEVLVTDKLKNKQIITSKTISLGVRIQNDLLELNIENFDFDKEEISNILKTYKFKKKYYRLKDGSFLNLESSGIESLLNIADSLNISEKDFSKDVIELPKYRTIYLDQLVKRDNNIIIKKDDNFKQIIREINEVADLSFIIPESIKNILRPYQVTGFNWLKTLQKYNFGGILADDMGLGKTIQVISLLIDEKEHDEKTSIVVCPSSLYINWQKEIMRFAPEVKVLVISGNIEEREKLIDTIKNYDVVITSYDLLKRDIDKYKSFVFKYVIADEAQYIKNNNTKNAIALKDLKSEVRFALTGTPMENSLSELWSIFDFIMPSYLYSYKRFKTEFETPIIKDNDNDAMVKLRKLVEPFILRRIKKDVLKELPDKTETIMYSNMTNEQEKMYAAYLDIAKKEMQYEIATNGFENSQIKILSLITRLRQLCCHPSLFIENYSGESAKLEQCLELIDGGINAGHKILLFSQFTSMLDIIKTQLDKKKIKYSMLTGQTKVDTRIDMVENFNKSKDLSVFLISLKAGGTGLNLTGADMVIHYDPWWNLSAQNQATDRAHRIGQKSNVQVFKLITQNSIEEKIQKLQDRKMDLTNSVIKAGETFINKMSKEDILDLFEK